MSPRKPKADKAIPETPKTPDSPDASPVPPLPSGAMGGIDLNAMWHAHEKARGTAWSVTERHDNCLSYFAGAQEFLASLEGKHLFDGNYVYRRRNLARAREDLANMLAWLTEGPLGKPRGPQ